LLTGILLLVSWVALGVSLAVLFGRDHGPQRDPKFEAEQKELVEYQLRQVRNAEAKQIAERDAQLKEMEATQAAYAKTEIGRLKALRDKGWITQEKYDADIKSEGIGNYPH
jgi:multidrug resistance efflux pump